MVWRVFVAWVVLMAAGCSLGPMEECNMDDCHRHAYRVQVYDGRWNAVDTLRGEMAYIQVVRAFMAESAGGWADCAGCQDVFTQGRLISDRPILILPNDTLKAGVNLLDTNLVPRPGLSSGSSLSPDSSLRLSKGTVRFEYEASFRGHPIHAVGTVVVVDSAGF